MTVTVRRYTLTDLEAMTGIWNTIVAEGVAFPQTEHLSIQEAEEFFASQSYTGVTEYQNHIAGLYILHPNNIGRCGHIANASYAVKNGCQGKGIGEALVKDSMLIAKQLGFNILQFNAVVATNLPALKLYQKLGFTQLGTIPGGFKLNDNHYADIIPHYIVL